MEKYIPLDAVLAEIEKLKAEALRKKSQCKRSGLEKIMHQIGAYNKVLSFIDTLEVKEVDLEKELKEDWLFADKTEVDCLESMCLTEDMFVSLAKKYFEFGMRANNPITASEDLEEVCEQLAENARKHKAETSSPFFSPTDYKQGVIDGANWQKSKDAKLIINAKDDGYRLGLATMKQQMMAEAVDGTFSTGEYADGTPIDAIFNFDKVVGNKYEEGEKVKIIVIKN